MRVFVDTSAWVALADRKQKESNDVGDFLESRGVHAVTTNHVLDEVITLAAARLGHKAAVALGTVIRSGGVAIVHVTPADEDAAWALFCDREDKSYSFTDCTSFVVMRTLGLEAAVTLDDDFRQEGFKVLP